ncbi:hypothetical protein KGMB02408_33760 [Bacteroides faecalis]|uniref:Uncharacterized protein n=1 Tax=Bacteroides faecalis TaxID=2447885 RepID=A0A401LY48_9BACE|nr:hypothetical protein KGMB02408_33760 [Bacteroides faecalis]
MGGDSRYGIVRPCKGYRFTVYGQVDVRSLQSPDELAFLTDGKAA